MFDTGAKVAPERVVVVGYYDVDKDVDPDLLLDELASLVSAAGAEVVARVFQRRRGRASIDPATYIGRGKAEHLKRLVSGNEANVVVFDNELSPAQIRELEKIAECRVIDRSELILDIFASRARTREAKLQVELAQLQYTAPRLRGMWTHLERQASTGSTGGVGTRGPGEKQIEIDRRIITRRLTRLRGELGRIHDRREREVQGRISKHFCVGLVGYTNAGKSTLMNAVTGAGTYVADQLFATLDTKTRRWQLESGIEVMLSDTVGFVRDLPHSLVASFRATLEEALHADLLVHVIDASHPQALEQISTVEQVLGELGCDASALVNVLNKVDAIDGGSEGEDDLIVLRSRLPNVVCVSATTGEGLDELRDLIARHCRESYVALAVRAPAGSGRLQAFARANTHVRKEDFDESGWQAEIHAPRWLVNRLKELCPEAHITALA